MEDALFKILSAAEKEAVLRIREKRQGEFKEHLDYVAEKVAKDLAISIKERSDDFKNSIDLEFKKNLEAYRSTARTSILNIIPVDFEFVKYEDGIQDSDWVSCWASLHVHRKYDDIFTIEDRKYIIKTALKLLEDEHGVDPLSVTVEDEDNIRYIQFRTKVSVSYERNKLTFFKQVWDSNECKKVIKPFTVDIKEEGRYGSKRLVTPIQVRNSDLFDDYSYHSMTALAKEVKWLYDHSYDMENGHKKAQNQSSELYDEVKGLVGDIAELEANYETTRDGVTVEAKFPSGSRIIFDYHEPWDEEKQEFVRTLRAQKIYDVKDTFKNVEFVIDLFRNQSLEQAVDDTVKNK